jgi:tripartite-type tricarboxylate transporter receptor subunit TctC
MSKSTVAAVLLAIFATTSGVAQEAYPLRPITMVVPFPAGGPSDVVARIVAERMRSSLGQPVVVENVTGAGGTIALTRVFQSAPDGYTPVIGNWATHVGATASFRVAYDITKDFAPVAMLAIAPLWLVGANSIPAKDLKELIVWLKANPGKAAAGTAGPGSLAHLSCIYFQSRTGTQFQLVPYRGGGQAVQDLVAGVVHLQCGVDASNTLSLVRSGKIRAYAVMRATRWSLAPEVPTVDEAGLPGFYIGSWNSLWVRHGTPKAVIDRLNAAAVESLADPAVGGKLVDLGQEVPPRSQQTPEALGAYHSAEMDRWLPMMKAQNIKPQ